MYLIQHAVLVLLCHQNIANGFIIFDIDFKFNYLNKEINARMSSFVPDKEIKTRWFLQELDHFNANESRKWEMKYYEELGYWRENGPIYLFLGGEGAVSHYWAITGIMNDLAKETYGAMYITEHRYYGDSKPFDKPDVENMQYLSSRQALADIAKFINYLKSLTKYKESKVVVIGGSYAGNLAAWMKALYPTLINAAIASSSPILAKKDFYEYLEKVKENYEFYGTAGCVDKIKILIQKYDSMLRSPEGIEQLKIDENICDACDMTVPENQQLFFMYKTYPFMFNSQYGTPKLIEYHCRQFNNKDYYRIFLNEHIKLFNYEGDQCHFYDFKTYIKELQDKLKASNSYAWLYQTCTEFGYFQTTSSKKQPFLNIPLDFFIKTCSGVFGNNFTEKRVDEGVEISNKLYGGLKPNVTNVVFTNGGIDPWSTISVLKDLSYDTPAVVVPAESHCTILHSDSDSDSRQLKEARKYVKNTIRKWIGASEYLK